MSEKKTPLYDQHVELGAKMVPFAGWVMPIQYSGVMEEHEAVRKRVGLFDISHMGEIFVRGAKARDFINQITTNNITKIGDGRCQYSVLCRESGAIIDDIISYQFSSVEFMVVVNAANTQKDFEWFQKNAPLDVSVTNESDQYCQLAIQGPLAAHVLQPIIDLDLYRLGTFHFSKARVDGMEVIVSRTGYTGEDGYEIYGKATDAKKLWNLLLEKGEAHGILPIGLAARNTLRLEAAYSLYGQEITEETNPLETRLGWVVSLDKTSFIGKEALAAVKKNGATRQLIGIKMTENGIPRQGFKIFKDERDIGIVTSGTFSPTLREPIAICLVNDISLKSGDTIDVDIRGKKMKAKIVPLPFYKAERPE